MADNSVDEALREIRDDSQIIHDSPKQDLVKYDSFKLPLSFQNPEEVEETINESKEPIKKSILRRLLHRTYKIKLLGRILRTAIGIIHLPVILKNIESLNHFKVRSSQELPKISLNVQKTSQNQHVLAESYEKEINRLNHQNYLLKKQQTEINDRETMKLSQLTREVNLTKLNLLEGLKDIENLNIKVNDLIIGLNENSRELNKIETLKVNLLSTSSKMQELIKEAKKRMPRKFDQKEFSEVILKEQDKVNESFYAAMEPSFRGNSKDIKSRLKVYLPLVKEIDTKIKRGPLIDLGCGDGKWLELINEVGVKFIGVDQNRLFISKCKERKLNVVEEDIFLFLKKQKKSSAKIITALHLIEHLNFPKQIILLQEILRVLKPGGIAIIETPNPENLLVGGSYFYLDPTHVRPIHPKTLEFLMKEEGYINVKVKRLNKFTEFNKADYNEVSDEFKQKWFFSEMDYAVIAYKPIGKKEK